ncbi:CYTH domain-containing protein [Alkaliphilus serpentinus]|uniref:CYTH domain-containing protein n=1 Tax=Alkaliphilus serpentinus TaxID=1482731 RepID=A0A833M784_9FIRM|nr:CYTH domain-containing protein [Alkaliphilus serpentinus]KAB3529847.1 CYTH domain-containing protein [Alkaliphilus serpentinus]
MELKYLLCKSDFLRLKEYLYENFDVISTIKQTNYYLDTEDYYLENQGITARVREVEGVRFEFTLKTKRFSVGKDYLHIKKELTIPLDFSTFNNILTGGFNDVKTINLQQFPPLEDFKEITSINVIGSLSTQRTAFEVVSCMEPLLLDENQFLDNEDFEVEWETPQPIVTDEKIKELFFILEIQPIQCFDSKRSRFIKVFKNKRGTNCTRVKLI